MGLGDLFSGIANRGNASQSMLGPLGANEAMSVSGAKQAMDQALMQLVNLKPGETFRGQVLDINARGITVSSGNSSFQAKFLEPVELHIGDQLNFEVRENQDGVVTIAPLKDSIILGEEGLIYKALKTAGLAATDHNLDAAEALLKNGMAMDREGITHFATEALKYPNVPISHLVLMEQSGLEINEDNIRNFENYSNWNSQTVEQLNTIKQEFPALLEQAVKELPTESVLKEGGSPESLESTSNQEVTSNKTELLKDLLQTIGRELPELKDSEEHPVKQMLSLVENYELADKEQKMQIKEQLLSVLKHNDTELKNTLGEQMSVKPEELSTEKLNHFYRKLDTMMEQMKNLSEQPSAELYEATSKVQGELDFLGQMNQNMSQSHTGMFLTEKMMTMLPIQMKNQITQGNLYVYSKKSGGWDLSAGVSLFLHLDMDELGPLDVMMEMKRKDVTMSFLLEDEESARLLREHLNELTMRLHKKGYHMSGTVRKKEDDLDFEKDFLKKGEMEKELLRYSFDMRV